MSLFCIVFANCRRIIVINNNGLLDEMSFLFQIVNPKMIESLRQQIQADVEKPFREKLGEVDGELDKARDDYKTLKYDHTFLKSEYEHEVAEHKRIVNELTLRYEAEVHCV